MCGRYTLSAPSEVLSDVFQVPEVQAREVTARYNICPTQEAAVVRVPEPGADRELAMLRWGLVPFWADDPGIGNRMINARAETAAQKPAFRNSFKSRRCLVVADGFYEWKKESGGKQPYWFHLPDNQPFGFAGLWSRWDKGEDLDEPLETFTILTTDAHPNVEGIHHRMPVVLRKDRYDVWLDPANEDKDALSELLTAEAGEYLEFHPVSREVNSPAHQGAGLIEPIG